MPAVDIDGHRIEYEDEGAGLPVVFIPGLTGSKASCKYQLSGLSEHYRIISYNLRLASRREAYTIDLLTEDLARFLTELKLDTAVIAGHSFGGLIAQNFALNYAQHISALILSSTFPYLSEQPSQKIIEWLAPGPVEFESKWTAFMRRLFGGRQAPAEDSDGLTWLAHQKGGLNKATLDARVNIIQEFNSSNRLGEINVPTLLIVGAEDRAPILAGTQMLYENIPDTTLEVIEGGDHFVFFTRHDLYNDVIDDFLMSRMASFS